MNDSISMPPNSWHKYHMTKVPIDDCEKLYHIEAIRCPEGTLVRPADCEKCEYGSAGNYKERWVMCKYNSEHPKVEVKDVRT